MIELKNVSKYYYQNGMIASGFTKVNLKLNMGEFVVITGESGSGKSTLLNVISGLDSYEEGEMYINGEETSHYTESDFEDYRRKYIGNIFQNFNLVNSYTVYQNVELVLLLNGENKKDIKTKVLDIIDTVGLKKFKNTKVSKLSGGQKQRVAIARALAKETPIIVADEPTGNLDTRSANSIMKLLNEISKDKLVVIVTHNKEQVEEYATRLITMNDGRVVEDKIVKKVNSDLDPSVKQYKNITLLNRYRLGIRNTFNIFSKFILIFLVFLFMSMVLIYSYSNSKRSQKNASLMGYNPAFTNNDTKRIVVKKKNKTPISNEDLKSLEAMEHINSVEADDVLLDSYVVLTESGKYTYVPGLVKSIKSFSDKLTYGRMPENDDEIVVVASFYDWYFSGDIDEIMASTYDLSSEYYVGSNIRKVKVVGLVLSNDLSTENNTYYVSDSIMDSVRFSCNQRFSTTTTYFQGKYNNYRNVSPSSKVGKGEVIISDNLTYSCDNMNCKNKLFKVIVSNIYYNIELDLHVSTTYTKNNFESITGSSANYDEAEGTVYINPDDFNNLYNKATYQSSVFIDDEDNIEEVKTALVDNGYVPLSIKEALFNASKEATAIMQLFTSFVMVFLVVALFFISYFVIKIILKSRSIYFTTIRILGGSRWVAKRILDIELFTNATFAYAIWMVLLYLIKIGKIEIKAITTLMPFISISECIIVYIILVIMSQLISNRFARKIFKQTVMKTYREEAN